MKRTGDGSVAEFERGDVVWGIDPFKQDSAIDDEPTDGSSDIAPRPWLIVSTESVPFHPEQYLCVTFTTRTWHDESVPISENGWVDGGAPNETAVMPWTITAIKHEYLDTTGELVDRLDIPAERVTGDGYQGRLRPEVVDTVTETLVGYLRASLTDPDERPS